MRKTIAALLLLAAVSPAGAETFRIDPARSSVTFKIGYLLVGHVQGSFKNFGGDFNYLEGSPRVWRASATIDPASIDTGVRKRDAHLRSPDFFDAHRCPAMAFVSDGVRSFQANESGFGTFQLHGNLTIHCVTRPVLLDVLWKGTEKDASGRLRAKAAATTVLSRKEFQMTKDEAMIGDKVDIAIRLESSPTEPNPGDK